MNPTLVFVCLALVFAAHSDAFPGMRGNGASGSNRDRDPSNPHYISKQEADAKASGDNPNTYTYTAQNGGSGIAIAHASNSGGGRVSSSAISGRPRSL